MQVTFFQNVGLVVLRFSSTTSGRLCKRCIDSTFVRASAISFFFGWWGVISFFFTLFTLPLNVVTWLRSTSLPAPPPDVVSPQGYGAAPSSGGSGADVLAIIALVLGGIALLITGGITLLGIGMIVAPVHANDAHSGASCIAITSLVCGLPGLLGVAAGVLRLVRRRRG